MPDGAALTSTELRQAFGLFPSGVTAVCGIRAGVPVGMSASSFTSVSLDPPLVSVCIARTSTTWPLLQGPHQLGVSVLAHDQAAAARQLSSKAGDRFAELSWSRQGDAVFIDDACLWLRCTVADELPAGDHVIALLALEAVEVFADRQPLVFHGSEYRRLMFPAQA